MGNIQILCLSGSLRKASYNSAVINAVCELAPDGIDITVFDKMAEMPLFNPDHEEHGPAVVMQLRNAIKKSDGLLIASPEYAHGISGALKNALDWLVSGEEFPYISVALINTSPRATYAQAALREVITTMSGNIIESASVSIPLLGSNLDTDGILKSTEISHLLIQSITALRDAIIKHK